MEEQKVKTEPVKTQRRIALSTDEMRLYLESKGVVCNTANNIFVENLYNAVKIMSFAPDKKSGLITTQSQVTLPILDMAKTVDMIMGRIGQRIRGFDIVGGYKVSMQSMQEALNRHIYFNHKFDEVNDLFVEIIEEAIKDKFVDPRKLPYSIKRKLKVIESQEEQKNHGEEATAELQDEKDKEEVPKVEKAKTSKNSKE